MTHPIQKYGFPFADPDFDALILGPPEPEERYCQNCGWSMPAATALELREGVCWRCLAPEESKLVELLGAANSAVSVLHASGNLSERGQKITALLLARFADAGIGGM